MRILGFHKEWEKLNQHAFTTFRYPRCDRDWYKGEQVQIVIKPRTRERKVLGIAEIIEHQKRDLDPWFKDKFTIVTDEEAVNDGFESREDMEKYMKNMYGLDYISLMNKLTISWIRKENW